MHEVAIAMGMVDELLRIGRENNAKSITRVSLKIGKISGIVTDSLKFAFDAVKLEHPVMLTAELTINEVPLIYDCNDCDKSFEADNFYFPSCPECDSFNLTLISGEEQDIENVELEV
ncbi:MAG TPA: hydrogenase maturation nickel metallochaperone HypA [Nitrospirae bacterium]|nr:hydrogenase maturation nickel metallochaperone HypA [Nitrospirota bacterium]HDO67501.1 hydrogenase maturation nickel metallochaperone HypA [Nitrospirota bacterium]HEW81675.1 hydrogenase maturation nickel metallochaperone HypA [Nitrospirota bacterium]